MLSGFVTEQHVSCHVTLLLPTRPGTRLPDEPQLPALHTEPASSPSTPSKKGFLLGAWLREIIIDYPEEAGNKEKIERKSDAEG